MWFYPLIDGTGGPALADMTVLISGGRITAVGTRVATPVPGGARTIDGRGKFLIPGLWDMHVHLSKAGEGALALFIANGMTSVRDMGGDADLLLRWRAETAAGTRVGPRVKTPGQMLESAKNVARMKSEGTVEPVDRYRRPVGTAADAERAVAELASKGVDFIKVRTLESREAYRAILEAAARHHLTEVGHPAWSIAAGLYPVGRASRRAWKNPGIGTPSESTQSESTLSCSRPCLSGELERATDSDLNRDGSAGPDPAAPVGRHRVVAGPGIPRSRP